MFLRSSRIKIVVVVLTPPDPVSPKIEDWRVVCSNSRVSALVNAVTAALPVVLFPKIVFAAMLERPVNGIPVKLVPVKVGVPVHDGALAPLLCNTWLVVPAAVNA